MATLMQRSESSVEGSAKASLLEEIGMLRLQLQKPTAVQYDVDSLWQQNKQLTWQLAVTEDKLYITSSLNVLAILGI